MAKNPFGKRSAALACLLSASLIAASGVPAFATSATETTSKTTTATVTNSQDTAVAPGSHRIATFNLELIGEDPAEITELLSDPSDARVQQLAETIQRVAPDVLVLTGIDIDEEGKNIDALNTNYLAVGQNGQRGIEYAHIYVGPINSGMDSGMDLNRDGTIGGAGDALGYGEYPGQAGMAVLSMYPIQRDQVRTFNELLWSDVPDSDAEEYLNSELASSVLPLSSTGHWDVPIKINGRLLHLLVSSPTQYETDPAQATEAQLARLEDENGFWADYVSEDPAASSYIVDDQGQRGGLGEPTESSDPFVIAGTLGSEELAGTDQLLDLDLIQDPEPAALSQPNTSATTSPRKATGTASANLKTATDTQVLDSEDQDDQDQAQQQGEVRTARTDYVLAAEELLVTSAGVFWPAPGEPGSHLVGCSDYSMSAGTGASSGYGLLLLETLKGVAEAPTDHRLVWTDISTVGRG